jgi:hypothetical protein
VGLGACVGPAGWAPSAVWLGRWVEIITCWEPWETGGTSAEPYAGFNNLLVPIRLFES